mgnify:FL=1|jgi:adenine deaminase
MISPEIIEKMPKAELHLHIEGTMEPEMCFELAKRNHIELEYTSVDELRDAYQFKNLQDFLDIYYQGCKVLVEEQDFYDLTWAYLEKAYQQNVRHTEIFFDPQAHTTRGIPFKRVVDSITHAMEDAESKFGITSGLIFCILRHMDIESALATVDEAIKYKDQLLGIGLDSTEVGLPPNLYREVFKRAREAGFKAVAHAGEEGPPEYVWKALDILKIDRLDHGNRSLEDDRLVERLVEEQMALTVCPLSNLKLKIVNDMSEHPLKIMLDKGLKATVNSDDPAYFGGHINANYLAVSKALNLDANDLYTLARNSFEASFLSAELATTYISELDEFAKNNGWN